MKLPALQFYPGDWHKDQGVQALDLEQRGAWFELLLMMHDSDERGVLVLNGQPMSEAVIARRLGLLNQTANQILTTLLTYGVVSRREHDGALFCRRMVKDEKIRQIRTESGKRGGNPSLVKQIPTKAPSKSQAKANQSPKQIPTPSITSSITTSVNKERGAANAAPTPAPQVLEAEKPVVGKKRSGAAGAAARPTLADIQAHAATAHPGPEAQAEAAAFHDHYQSNGWRVGKNPMTDWPAAFRQWMRRRPQFQPAGVDSPPYRGGAGGGAATPARARTAPKPNDPTRYS